MEHMQRESVETSDAIKALEIGIQSPECIGHDACVCAYGWFACVDSPSCAVYVPEIGFVECSGLWDAVMEYLERLSEKYFEYDQEVPDYDWWNLGG